MLTDTERHVVRFVTAWLSVWSEVQIVCVWSCWCHCYPTLASFKSRLVLPFWSRLSQIVMEKRPLNGCNVVVLKERHLLILYTMHCNNHTFLYLSTVWLLYLQSCRCLCAVVLCGQCATRLSCSRATHTMPHVPVQAPGRNAPLVRFSISESAWSCSSDAVKMACMCLCTERLDESESQCRVLQQQLEAWRREIRNIWPHTHADGVRGHWKCRTWKCGTKCQYMKMRYLLGMWQAFVVSVWLYGWLLLQKE